MMLRFDGLLKSRCSDGLMLDRYSCWRMLYRFHADMLPISLRRLIIATRRPIAASLACATLFIAPMISPR